MGNAELIAKNLERVGDMSIEIRDTAVSKLDNICLSDPNIADTIAMAIMGIAGQAKVSFGNVTFGVCVLYNCISD